jgi:hypothetical protein
MSSTVLTAVDAQAELRRLELERAAAIDAGLAGNDLFMADLEEDLAAARAAYVGLAVTEIARLRAHLDGPLRG